MGFLMTWNGERNHLTAVISIKTKRYKDFANARELQMTRNLQYHRIQQQMITNLITKKKIETKENRISNLEKRQ